MLWKVKEKNTLPVVRWFQQDKKKKMLPQGWSPVLMRSLNEQRREEEEEERIQWAEEEEGEEDSQAGIPETWYTVAVPAKQRTAPVVDQSRRMQKKEPHCCCYCHCCCWRMQPAFSPLCFVSARIITVEEEEEAKEEKWADEREEDRHAMSIACMLTFPILKKRGGQANGLCSAQDSSDAAFHRQGKWWASAGAASVHGRCTASTNRYVGTHAHRAPRKDARPSRSQARRGTPLTLLPMRRQAQSGGEGEHFTGRVWVLLYLFIYFFGEVLKGKKREGNEGILMNGHLPWTSF